ncbi:hypothetical protein IJD44_09725 [bacterium]|nr:hypothetical protein [bacterium]
MNEKNVIGFWGYPHPTLIEEYKEKYPTAKWIDLDIDYNFPKQDILPESYCAIIKNIINAAKFYKDRFIVILAPIGKDKCDSGWFAAEVLKDMGFNVITSIFEEKTYKKDVVISTSNLPLRQKFELITKGIYEAETPDLKQCKAKFGFWGVPPNDLSILELFPNETHVYGWTRCVEAMTPADIELEMFIDKDVPTVFYSQSFCSKAQLAKYLADKYNGLYIDIDDNATNSTKAKIEAFLRLR